MGFLSNILHNVIWRLRKIQVFALVGKSGTGKSFRAQLIAVKYKIELIIDDGILIKENKILSGRSAKKEKIPFTAIRTALFDNPQHLYEVKTALEKEQFKKILLIGISKGMVDKIAKRLNLPPVMKYIQIEDIASKEEIESARRSRDLEGKHIIPVPAIEVKRNYSHIFFDSIKIFLKKQFQVSGKQKVFEKSIVTPEFSRRGELSISETALIQMIMHCIDEFDPRIKPERIILKKQIYGYNLRIIIRVPFGMELASSIHNLQQYIIQNIEKFTGITLKDVDITVGAIS
jgi:hypothetical protein